MGDSRPPPAEFDLVDSFARRRGADVEIVLAEPKTELAVTTATVQLRQGKRSADATGDFAESAAGRRLTVRVRRAELSDGTWSLAVRKDDGSIAPLAARLLIQGDRPVVLLWGAQGARTQVPTGRPDDPKRKALSSGARLLDRALSVLPEDRAKTMRKQARRAARRVLG
jgi:hypothetical protein